MNGTPVQPWEDGHVLQLCATSALGLVAIVVGWYGASGSALVDRQTLWLNLGVAGTVVAALGNCVWLLRGRGAVGARRRQLVSMAPSPSSPPAASGGAGLVRASGMARVHRADCPLVAGKKVRKAVTADGDACGVCLS